MNPPRLACLVALALAQQLAAATALTVYNQGFAVIRETVPLDLKAGVNSASFSGVTAELEPDSVVLRDPAGQRKIGILEQSYRAETISQHLLLKLNEGKTITFLVRDQEGREHPVKGKIIRAGREPGERGTWSTQETDAFSAEQGSVEDPGESPVIEIDGELRFSLPGEPVFPSLANGEVLKPTLAWQLSSEKEQKFDAELGYVSGGLTWAASYNLVSPEEGGPIEVTGWITVENSAGVDFRDANLKLMAGDVSKIVHTRREDEVLKLMEADLVPPSAEPTVKEKAFDEFHLYSIPNRVTLLNGESKQVQFIRASGVRSEVVYVYEPSRVRGGEVHPSNGKNPRFARDSLTEVSVFREFVNSKENNLGLPLPAGKTRFHRRDSSDNQVEFTGEDSISHTPQGEVVRIRTGQSLNLVGERRQTDFHLSNREEQAEESFEIRLRNRRKEPVVIRAVEHLARSVNWTILEKSQDFVKTDHDTVEFKVSVAPDEEKVLTYKVRYDWK